MAVLPRTPEEPLEGPAQLLEMDPRRTRIAEALSGIQGVRDGVLESFELSDGVRITSANATVIEERLSEHFGADYPELLGEPVGLYRQARINRNSRN